MNNVHRGAILCGLLARAVCTARGDEAQSLDRFLNRLGLSELRLVHGERVLAREAAADKRIALARQLADAYAEELVAAADEPERFTALRIRVERLLDAAPEARTPALDVVLLQAEYQRAESLMIRWLDDPAERAARDEAGQILARIQPLLVSRQEELANAADKAADAVDNIKSDQQRQLAEQQLQRQRMIATRADYFAGWAAYYLAVARPGKAMETSGFTRARQHFCRVLDVAEEKDYEPVDVESLGLESIWRARSVIGLGLSELGLKHTAAAAQIFGWLSHSSVPPVIRDQAAYWHVQGALNAGLLNDAGQLAANEVAGFSGSPSAGKSSLCIATIRAGANFEPSREQRRQLIEAGVRGLARMRQFDTLDKLSDRYQLDQGPEAGDFQLTWLRGRRQYLAAEASKQPEGFRTAAASLSTALDHPQARIDLAEAGQARYYLGWARFRLDELETAARLFHEAASTLRSSAPEVALQAAWMRCTCLVQLSAKNKRQVTPAIAALQAFKQEFPASNEAQQADLLVTRLRQSYGTPDEAIRELAAIKPGEPTYPAAQYELCQLKYQLWSKAKSDPPKAEPLAADLLTTVERFLALSDKSSDGERQLKAALLAVDVLFSPATPDLTRIGQIVARVAQSAEGLDPSHLVAIEYQYRRLQLAQKTGNAETMKTAADWIARHGGGTPYELPALVAAARSADQAVASASAAERKTAIAEAAQVYDRVVTLLGDSAAILTTSKNALAAATKLAQYDEEQGDWPRAAERWSRLAKALPRDRRLVRHAGLACFRAERYPEALEHWRTLLGGVESGSDDWLEAKYYQLACLQQTDRASSGKVWKQFKVLFPEVKSTPWRQKFAELEGQFP